MISPCVGRYGVVVDLPSVVAAIATSENVDSVVTFVHSRAVPVYSKTIACQNLVLIIYIDQNIMIHSDSMSMIT